MNMNPRCRIQLVSDLHLDANTWIDPSVPWTHPQADLVVVAGDVGNGTSHFALLRKLFPDVPILMVAGNHEFFGLWWHSALGAIRIEAAKYDIDLIENESRTIGGVQFLGCTLWTDFDFYGRKNRASLMEKAPSMVLDYGHIGHAGLTGKPYLPDTYTEHRLLMSMLALSDPMNQTVPTPKGIRALRPMDTVKRHHDSKAWLSEQLRVPSSVPRVVMTHHLPHEGSVAPIYASAISNPAFVSRCNELFELPGSPDFWFHGHSHLGARHRVGRTEVISNPMGRRLRSGDNENDSFDRGLLIDIPMSVGSAGG